MRHTVESRDARHDRIVVEVVETIVLSPIEAAAGVPFFFKQWGAWTPERGGKATGLTRFVAGNPAARPPAIYGRGPGDVDMRRVGKRAAGDLLDGCRHHAWPELPR